jgi:hypothetical protein
MALSIARHEWVLHHRVICKSVFLSFRRLFISHMCLGINYDAYCDTSCSVPLLRHVKMERKGLEESFVTQHLRTELVVHVGTRLPEMATCLLATLTRLGITLVTTCHLVSRTHHAKKYMYHVALVHLRTICRTRREENEIATRIASSPWVEKRMVRPGLEPGAFCVLDRCDNQLRHRTSL